MTLIAVFGAALILAAASLAIQPAAKRQKIRIPRDLPRAPRRDISTGARD